MKNLKAIILIVLGSFILATGFAFAGNVSFDQAGDPTLWKGTDGGPQTLPVLNIVTSTATAPAAATTTVAPTPPATVPAVTTPPPAPPAPTPSIGESIKKFVAGNMSNIVMGGIGAYLGLALIGGPVGIALGILFGLTTVYMYNM